jgi:hypothetical protein
VVDTYQLQSSNSKSKAFYSYLRMDAVTILSVAAAAVQFVDFASRVVSSAWEIYRSPSGETLIEYEASTLARDLAYLATQIHNKSELFTSEMPYAGENESERQLRGLCKECLKINTEMQSALSTAKEKEGASEFGSSGHSAVRTFRKALEKVWGHKKTEALVDRIHSVRQQMMMSTLVCLW